MELRAFVAGGNRRALTCTVALGVLLVLLASNGALACTASDPGTGSVEETSDPQPSAPEETSPARRGTTETPGGGEGLAGVEAQIVEAVEQYYYAVDYEQWDYSYNNLDSESKALFTEEEWSEKNQFFADAEGLELDSMEIGVTMDGSTGAEVEVDRTFKDGTSITRNTYFVWEEGWWRHHLTEEEKEIFMPEASYEEFVGAQGAEAPDGEISTSEEIEAVIREHYEAIGDGDFEEAYSYFGPTFRSTTDEASWISEEESSDVTGSTINSVVVEDVQGDLAGATVDVSFEDSTGTPRFVILWGLVREDREWKLEEVLASEKLDAGTSNEGSQEGDYSTEEMYSGEILREVTLYLDGYDEGVMRSAADELRSTDPDHAVLFIHYVDSEGLGIGTGVAFRNADDMAEFGSAFYRDDSTTWEDEEGIIIREESYGEYGAELEEKLLTESKPYTPIWICQDLDECRPI